MIKLPVKDEETGEETCLKLRLVLGPLDSEGKPIVFVTNLLGKKRYPRGGGDHRALRKTLKRGDDV